MSSKGNLRPNPEFKVGNVLAVGADHRVEGLLKTKKFKEKCKEWLLDDKNGGFSILRQVAEGYKGVKPSDRIGAITLMLKCAGMLAERIEVERVDPVMEMRQDELMEAARVAMLEIKGGIGKAVETGTKVVLENEWNKV